MTLLFLNTIAFLRPSERAQLKHWAQRQRHKETGRPLNTHMVCIFLGAAVQVRKTCKERVREWASLMFLDSYLLISLFFSDMKRHVLTHQH